MSTSTVTVEKSLAAAPEHVAAALASPQALGTWLCDEALVEKKDGGWLVLKWHGGRRRDGLWTTFAPPQRLAWRWREGLDGPVSDVAFELAPEGAGTRLRVARSGVEPGGEDEVSQSWREHLDDLSLYLERGISGRMARRPMMGIAPTEVDATVVAQHGLAVDHGVYLASLSPGMGAEAAGLQSGDVIVHVGEHPVRDWPGLAAALSAHRAGDTVDVTFWRGESRHVTPLTLAGRPEQPVPADRESARTLVRQQTADLIAEIREATAGLGEAEASVRPTPDDWSVREVLGHLVISETLGHEDLGRLATDSDPFPWSSATYDLRQKLISEASLDELVSRYLAALRESEALSLAALDASDAPAIYCTVARNYTYGRTHVDEHLAQIRVARSAALVEG